MTSLRIAALRSMNLSAEELVIREKQFDGVTNPVKHTGLMAVHWAASQHPKLTSGVLAMGTNKSGLERFATGGVSRVYMLDEDTVLKADTPSVAMSRKDSERYADRLRFEHDALVAYVGPAIVPHSIDIGPHPEFHRLDCVRMLQPFVKLNYIQLGEEKAEDIPLLSERIQRTSTTHPDFRSEATSLVASYRELFADHDLAVDILGNNNVGLSRGNLHLTIPDSQPVNRSHRPVQAIIENCFDNLEIALQLAV
jgi:hypothetical protein